MRCCRDPSCERDSEWAAQLDVRHRQPFYHVRDGLVGRLCFHMQGKVKTETECDLIFDGQVLPDENDCVNLFKAVRISKYVAQENIEPLPYPRRCTHRVLPNYFEGYDPVTGRHAVLDSSMRCIRCPVFSPRAPSVLYAHCTRDAFASVGPCVVVGQHKVHPAFAGTCQTRSSRSSTQTRATRSSALQRPSARTVTCSCVTTLCPR